MNSQVTQKLNPRNSVSVINWQRAFIFIFLVVLMGLLPFVAAGRLDWWQAWVYCTAMIGINILSRYLVFRKNPELIVERFRFTGSEGIKNWDRLLAPLIGIVVPLLVSIVAGLDKRYDWSPDISITLQFAAIILLLLSGAFGIWAMVENPFFSSVVRIQKDRGQTVITSGPYRFVRHPAYSENVIWWLATPVVFGALWAFVPALLMIISLIIRTALEDRTLQAELPGYADYAQHTRYRLVPGMW